jgi:hypothetical protein
VGGTGFKKPAGEPKLSAPIELTEDETAALIDLLVGTIERHLFPQSVHIQRLRNILEKVRPVPAPLSDLGTETDTPEMEDI